MRIIIRVRWLLPALFALVACNSQEKAAAYHAEKKARLVSAFPAGMSRSEVHARLRSDAQGQAQVPGNSGTRPATGWSAEPPVPDGTWCAAVEARTGRTVASFERYSMVDGFFSLCYYWFYFDQADTLIDSDWQYQSD